MLPYTETAPAMLHWRGRGGEEADVLLEDRRGRLVAIAIKAGASVGHADLRGMRALARLAGDRFLAGLVLCTARRTTPSAIGCGHCRSRHCGVNRECQAHHTNRYATGQRISFASCASPSSIRRLCSIGR